MRALYEMAFRLAMQIAAKYLKDVTPDKWDEAINVMSYEITNMFMDSLEQGHFSGIPAEMRLEYEARILAALRALGIVRTV